MYPLKLGLPLGMEFYRTEQINIGDVITLTKSFIRGGYYQGIVVGKLDNSLLVMESIDNSYVGNRLVDISDVFTSVAKK